MVRLARIELFAPDEIAIVHVMNRVVRRCFLFGDDPISGKNFDHRKRWIEARLELLAASMGIDLLCFAILSNHFHLILRSRPDVVSTWDDTEVARRWLALCPNRKNRVGSAVEPNEWELNAIRNNPVKLQKIRSRLSDIAWWMRLLCQNIAIRANHEDREIGRFFQSRYRAVRLCDEEAILTCAAYVDLNPIRAAMAQTLESSDFTSVQRRIESMQAISPGEIERIESEKNCQHDNRSKRPRSKDRYLSPLTIDELRDNLGSHHSQSGYRCSDKGFLPMSTIEYLELLDWTARQIVRGKRGSTPTELPSILARLSIQPEIWFELVQSFGKLFCIVAGKPTTVDESRSRIRYRRFHLRKRARELLQTES